MPNFQLDLKKKCRVLVTVTVSAKNEKKKCILLFWKNKSPTFKFPGPTIRIFTI